LQYLDIGFVVRKGADFVVIFHVAPQKHFNRGVVWGVAVHELLFYEALGLIACLPTNRIWLGVRSLLYSPSRRLSRTGGGLYPFRSVEWGLSYPHRTIVAPVEVNIVHFLVEGAFLVCMGCCATGKK